ncbi:MAG: RNA polymerase sigma factor [Bacteroidia bacterium]
MTNQIHISDEELMALLMKGSEPAFNILYKRYRKKLVHFSQSFLGSKEQSEDLVQDIFIKLIQQPHLFKQGNSFASWIFTIVKNNCFNLLRNEKKRHELRHTHIPSNPSIEQQSSKDFLSLKNKINALYQSLNEKEKLVFVLRFELELSIKETAEIANIPEGSVKSCQFYLLKKITPHIKEYQHEKH